MRTRMPSAEGSLLCDLPNYRSPYRIRQAIAWFHDRAVDLRSCWPIVDQAEKQTVVTKTLSDRRCKNFSFMLMSDAA